MKRWFKIIGLCVLIIAFLPIFGIAIVYIVLE